VQPAGAGATPQPTAEVASQFQTHMQALAATHPLAPRGLTPQERRAAMVNAGLAPVVKASIVQVARYRPAPARQLAPADALFPVAKAIAGVFGPLPHPKGHEGLEAWLAKEQAEPAAAIDLTEARRCNLAAETEAALAASVPLVAAAEAQPSQVVPAAEVQGPDLTPNRAQPKLAARRPA